MRRQWKSIFNIIGLFIIMIVSGGVQTTLWLQFFGSFPPPVFWIIVLAYIILYRPPVLSLILVYSMGFAIMSFSAISMGMVFLNLFVLYTIISMMKSRFYWGGVGYFTLVCWISTFMFHATYLLSSSFFENQHAEILFWHRLTQIIITPLFAFIYYHALKKLDQWTLVEDIQLTAEGLDL